MHVKNDEIKEVYNNWRNAVMVNDLPFLEQLFSTDFVATRSVGKPKSKDEELLWLGVRNVRYLYWVDNRIVIDSNENSGVIKCSQTIDAIVYDLPAKIDREIMLTFVKQDKGWHLQQFKENPVRFT